MSDLVERLEEFHAAASNPIVHRVVIEAAERIKELEAENARLREENEMLKKQLIGEEDSWHSGYRYGRGNPMTHDAHRRAEEAVDYLSKKLAGRQPSGYNNLVITTLDAKLLVDLIRKLAGLEGEDV